MRRTPEELLRWYSHNKAWHRARDLCKMRNRYMCEECGRSGELEVHHKIALTLDNYRDPMISLNQDNLQCLCRSCHMVKRGAGAIIDCIDFTEYGDLILKEYYERNDNPPG